MRIAALSDIHGNLPALDAVLADVARRGCELVVNLGDILSGPLFPAETARRLMALDLPTIRGNHERQLLEQAPERMGASDAYARGRLDDAALDWLRALPAALRLGEDVLLCHGTPRSDLEYFLEDVDAAGARPAAPDKVAERAGDADAGLILCGHTHLPRSVQLPDGRLVVNPGSVGLPAYAWDQPYPHVMEAGTPHARYAIVERGAHGWSVMHVALAYDHGTSARAAEQHGRPEWAHALRHGRMPPPARGAAA
ncbi:metallophosphoesterase family protein [Fulvimonas soli]|uniref:Putative phosphoesterase n=1 Tax=Fulvimonas soli TaxID=155197 RepID=A0A316IK46_9GAMM|nr:metallophosphoesterase family protein [Fulvimonas soli]PWK92884.1 putative phosphoesterase [Fulvimonas soli]TNY26605.1 YfcE family phosphodiesterase [Fulvimonas soli]